MTSDLAGKASSRAAATKKSAAQILREEIREALEAMDRSPKQLFISALSGGLDVGFSVFLMGAVLTAARNQFSTPLTSILVANMYSVGFIFVIVGRSELFTEQTALAVLPVLRRRASVGTLLRLWATVYVGNLAGAAGFAALISYVGPALKVVDVQAFGEIGHRMVDHGNLEIFLSAVLAGWLMGLLSWMVVAARDTIGQIVIVWIITTAIGLGGLHHVVLGSVEVLTAIFDQQGVGGMEFFRFLVFATLGNAIGGSVFVALIKYGHANPASS